jgi:hypothetical protein
MIETASPAPRFPENHGLGSGPPRKASAGPLPGPGGGGESATELVGEGLVFASRLGERGAAWEGLVGLADRSGRSVQGGPPSEIPGLESGLHPPDRAEQRGAHGGQGQRRAGARAPGGTEPQA